MQFKIPEQYVIGKFLQHTGFPVYKASVRAYNACCPVCREGNSWGKKKRLFYFPAKDQLYCHNCNRSWSSLNWIKQVCDITYQEIRSEVLSNSLCKPELDINTISIPQNTNTSSTLPEDSINLFDKEQVKYYKDNPVVRKGLSVIKSRLLHRAVNRPTALYISLTDFIHKNRLCVPFYDLNRKIVFYQTRKIFKDSSPKYLSKMHEEKSVYGIDRIDVAFPYIFVLEGPIDAMFIKNGVAVCGTSMTKRQELQLQQFPGHQVIWCLDNQRLDVTSAEKTYELKNKGYQVFEWPEGIKYKDFNELCMGENLHQISSDFILDNRRSNDLQAVLSGIKL